MTPLQIILLILLTLLIIAAAYLFFSWRYTERIALKFTALGTVVGWQNVKLPFMGRAIIQYSKKGKPMQAQSNLKFRSRKPKQRGKRLWTITVFPTKDKQKVYIARKVK